MCGFGDRHLGQCIFQIVTAIAVLERISDSELEELERSQADFVLSGELPRHSPAEDTCIPSCASASPSMAVLPAFITNVATHGQPEESLPAICGCGNAASSMGRMGQARILSESTPLPVALPAPIRSARWALPRLSRHISGTLYNLRKYCRRDGPREACALVNYRMSSMLTISKGLRLLGVRCIISPCHHVR